MVLWVEQSLGEQDDLGLISALSKCFSLLVYTVQCQGIYIEPAILKLFSVDTLGLKNIFSSTALAKRRLE